MKKKLEADLISIAHRILKLKNKSELVQLHKETQKLYEKLSVLLFIEENFGEVKPTIGYADIEKKIEEVFETPAQVVAAEEHEAEIEAASKELVIPEIETETQETVEHVAEKYIESPIAESIEEEILTEVVPIQAEVAEEIEKESEEETSVSQEAEIELQPATATEPLFRPAFELAFESKIDEVKEEVKETVKNKSIQITINDLLGPNYSDPVFVKPEELEKEVKSQPVVDVPVEINVPELSSIAQIHKSDTEIKSISLNDRLSKGITVGLNDRIAFMKHLFANSSEDYNRVLSQLITLDTIQEAQSFINDMVKPDYNNWEGKEEYEARFMEILEKRFS